MVKITRTKFYIILILSKKILSKGWILAQNIVKWTNGNLSRRWIACWRLWLWISLEELLQIKFYIYSKLLPISIILFLFTFCVALRCCEQASGEIKSKIMSSTVMLLLVLSPLLTPFQWLNDCITFLDKEWREWYNHDHKFSILSRNHYFRTLSLSPLPSSSALEREGKRSKTDGEFATGFSFNWWIRDEMFFRKCRIYYINLKTLKGARINSWRIYRNVFRVCLLSILFFPLAFFFNKAQRGELKLCPETGLLIHCCLFPGMFNVFDCQTNFWVSFWVGDQLSNRRWFSSCTLHDILFPILTTCSTTWKQVLQWLYLTQFEEKDGEEKRGPGERKEERKWNGKEGEEEKKWRCVKAHKSNSIRNLIRRIQRKKERNKMSSWLVS